MKTIAQAAAGYFAAHQVQSTSRSSQYVRNVCLRNVLRGVDCDRPMAEFDAKAIEAALERLRERRNLGVSAMHNYRHAVRHFVLWCVEMKIIPGNDYLDRRRKTARKDEASATTISREHETTLIAFKHCAEFMAEEASRILAALGIKDPGTKRKKKGN